MSYPPGQYPQQPGQYPQQPGQQPQGGQYQPPGGQQYPPQGGQYPQQGGQYPQQGGQYPQQGGQYPQQGGQSPAGGQQYPPQPGYTPPGGQYPPPGQGYPPGGQYPPGPQFPGAAPARSRGKAPLIIGIIVAVLVLGGVAAFAIPKLTGKDSGVAACEAMRDRTGIGGVQVQGSTKLTEEQYKKVRKVFEDSKYSDIKDHGTKLMDTVWQITQASTSSDPSTALNSISTLTSEISGLTAACANHGVTINLNLK